MGYLKIQNLYKDQTILLFKEVWALEKIHGTSCHLSWDGNKVSYFSGGEKHETFVKLFNNDFLVAKFTEIFGQTCVTFFGEGYGGKCQGMSATYGKELKFIVFDVKVNDKWLNVPNATDAAQKFNLDFVDYVKIPTTLEAIDAERDKDSTQAVRNGMGNGHIREGVVLRPLEEFTLNNGKRVICKHKRDEFRETKTPRPIVNPDQLKVLEDADKIADEFVTAMRLNHILDKIPNHSIEKMSEIISAMISDIMTEGKGEVVDNQVVRKFISKKTVLMYKNLLKQKLS